MKRIISVIMAVLLLIPLAACKKNVETPTEQPTAEPTIQPTTEITEQPTVEPTDAPDLSEADIAFNEIDLELFISVVTSDGMTYHQFVKDPASFGIDEADVERGWGELSYENYLEGAQEDAELKARLLALDYDSLSDYNKLAYDNLMMLIEAGEAEGDTYYYSEPLKPLNGEHSMMPLMLTLYEISERSDLDNFILLLEDSANYLMKIEQFEREKADKGLFMTENALDQVLKTCRDYVNAGEDFYLIEFCNEVLEDDALGLTDAEKQEYGNRCRSFIIDTLLPEYGHLADTLESLRDQCNEMVGVCEKGDAAIKWFSDSIGSQSGCYYSPDVIMQHLEQFITEKYDLMYSILYSDFNGIYSDYFNDVTSGSAEGDVAYLEGLIVSLYPELPKQQIEYVTVPDAVADDFSPAAYLISAFDDPTRNVVMFNPSSDDSTLLFTLAHECFPGHLYQTQYFRQLDGLSLTQQLIAPSGYTEGWAVFTETHIAGYCDKYNADCCTVRQLESSLFNILIPAYVSLNVNLNGWTEDEVGEYLEEFGVNQSGYRSILYEYSVDMPLYFFDYALGYMCTDMIYSQAAPSNNAENLAFFTEYLGYGPCMFNILFKKFNIDF